MIDTDSCKTCRYFDSKDWDSKTKNWCRYNDLPAINEGLCGHYESMLEPCPFCGHTEPKIGENWDRDHCTYIYCPMCGGRGGNGWTYDAAVSAWNRRVKE